MHRTWIRTAYKGLTLVAAVWLATLAADPPTLLSHTAENRLLAIGDIHGSHDGFTTILRKTGMVDEALHWSGGRAVLVQTGDYTDRGADVRRVMDLLMQLEKEAKAAGGQVIALAGNHEVMNMIGDWRDVTPEICATFASPKSEARREDAWKLYERVAKARAGVTTPPATVYQQTREAWLEKHPPGCLEYREAMAPGGVYGRWLREKDIAAVVGDTLFMHAGLNPSRGVQQVNDVNDRARAEVKRLDAFRKRISDRRLALPFFNLQEVLDVAVVELQVANGALTTAKAEGTEVALDVPLLREAQELTGIAKWSLIDPEGPLWFRGYANWNEASTAAQVAAFLDHMKLARIVVGHTPTREHRIVTRYGGRVVTLDTGMLATYYKGRPSALELTGGRMKAIYPDSEADLTALPKSAAIAH